MYLMYARYIFSSPTLAVTLSTKLAVTLDVQWAYKVGQNKYKPGILMKTIM